MVGEINVVRRVTLGGLAVNLLLAAAKGAGGVFFHSQALVADAIHSLSDIVTDVAVLLGARYWGQPADEDHPYGHGKIEALVTLFIAGSMAVVGWELTRHAVSSLVEAKRYNPGLLALVCAVVSVFVKEALFQWTRCQARKVNSSALEANAWHHRSDALSSIPVAIAIGLTHFVPSLWWADAVGALVVALFIAVFVWEIARPCLQELIDANVASKAATVEALARQIPGVRNVHRCRARRYGSAFQADLHIQVDPTLSIVEAHRLGHAVKRAALQADLDVTDVIVHIEPDDTQNN